MAKTTKNKDLFGLRKRAAKVIPGTTHRPKGMARVASGLGSAIETVRDRVTGGPAKRKAAAKKAADTRKRNARRRSTAAKKAARTRAKTHV